jgi:hypothetical protein
MHRRHMQDPTRKYHTVCGYRATEFEWLRMGRFPDNITCKRCKKMIASPKNKAKFSAVTG